MFSMKKSVIIDTREIKGVIFDYGGTLDSRGVHWSVIIYEGYKANAVNVEKSLFREAYVYTERLLAKECLVDASFNFYDLMRLKVELELTYLKKLTPIEVSESLIESIARYCYKAARECVEESRNVLEVLSLRYPLVMVSNFYGNLKSVLSDFGILKYFKVVVESSVVGVRKPDPSIFLLGVNALGVLPEEILVVGDSLENDIMPASEIGCKTVWLKGNGWNKSGDESGKWNVISAITAITDFL